MRCSDTTVINSPTKHSGNLGRQHFHIWKHTTLLHTTCTLVHTFKNLLNYTVCTDCKVYRKAKHVLTRSLRTRNFLFISLKYVHIGQTAWQKFIDVSEAPVVSILSSKKLTISHIPEYSIFLVTAHRPKIFKSTLI